MRLIDIDKLHYIRKWFEDSGKSEVVVFAKEIDKAPTVKAIPIEWIENYVKNKFCLADWYGGFIGGINMMLEDWETENEIFDKKINKINR